MYYTRREFFAVAETLGHDAIDAAAFVSQAGALEQADDAFTELIEAKDQRKILVLPS